MVLRTSNSTGTIQDVLTLDTDKNSTFTGNVIGKSIVVGPAANLNDTTGVSGTLQFGNGNTAFVTGSADAYIYKNQSALGTLPVGTLTFQLRSDSTGGAFAFVGQQTPIPLLKIDSSGSSTFAGTLSFVGGSSSGNLTFGPGNELRFGSSNEFGLFFSSSVSNIRVNSGALAIRADDLRLTNQANTVTNLKIGSNGNIAQANTSPITDPFVNTAASEQWMTYQIGKAGVLGAYKNNNESMFGFNTYFSAPSGANKAIISDIGGTATRYYADRITFNTLTSSGTTQTQTERMRINSAGNVGIGTDSPDAKLHIYGSSTLTEMYLGEDAAADKAGILKYTQGDGSGTGVITLSHWGNSSLTEGLAIKYGGNVGIGTTLPTSTLSVQGTTNNGINVIGVGTTANRCYVGLNASNHGQLFCTGSSGQGPSLISSAGADSYISGGRFGILTTSPSAPLDVAAGGSAHQIGAAIFHENSTTAYLTTSFNSRPTHTLYGINTTNTYVGTRLSNGGNTEFFHGIVKGANNGEMKYVFQGYNGTAYQEFGYIDCYTTGAGSLVMSGDIVAYSDKKLKKNIKTLDGSKVYKMRGVSFDRIDTDKKSSGVIAQEMQEVAPELVNENGDTLGVAYGNISGYLIEAIKDLKAEIEGLKNKPCACNNCNCKE